jgi:hypothetical protein
MQRWHAWFKRLQIAHIAASGPDKRRRHNEAASCRVLMNFLCFDLFAGRADEDELFQTRSKFWDRPEVQHGVAARGVY